MSKFTVVIGLEVHTSITASKRKLFSKGANSNDLENPNQDLDLLDLGLPGTLPILNKEVVYHAIRTCLALNMKITRLFSFDRKSYFYPDLPLGYQITQFYHPIGVDGNLPVYIDKIKKNIRIRQLHMETDAGKSIHKDDCTLLDYNRCGSPLMEIVTQPDFSNADEVIFFIRMLRATLKQIGSSDANMELGNFRVDVSISISNTQELGTRAEIKNLNSFRAIRKAIEHEKERQEKILLNNGTVAQETRLFDEKTGKTFLMRSKEDASGYMYFPDPDLPKFLVDDAIISEQAERITDLPQKMFEWMTKTFGPNENFINMVEEPFIHSFVKRSLESCGEEVQKQVLKLIAGEIFARLKEDNSIPISPNNLQKLAKIILEKNLSSAIIKTILDYMWENDENPAEIIDAKGLEQVEDEGLIRKYVLEVLSNNPSEVQRYLEGKTNLRGFFLGQAMKKNKIEPRMLNKILDEELGKLT